MDAMAQLAHVEVLVCATHDMKHMLFASYLQPWHGNLALATQGLYGDALVLITSHVMQAEFVVCGVRAVHGVVAMAARDASAPEWRWTDFFELSAAEEHTLKRQLAGKLLVRYTDVVNGAKPFAMEVNGIPAYTVEGMGEWVKEHSEVRRAASAGSPEFDIKRLDELKCKSMVVNGCQVAWSGNTKPNVGYIKAWADNNLSKWDSSIERRAGNIDPNLSMASQRFVTTNTSSLWSLIATVVDQHKKGGPIQQDLVDAFIRIRLLLYVDATSDEILATPHGVAWRAVVHGEACCRMFASRVHTHPC